MSEYRGDEALRAAVRNLEATHRAAYIEALAANAERNDQSLQAALTPEMLAGANAIRLTTLMREHAQRRLSHNGLRALFGKQPVEIIFLDSNDKIIEPQRQKERRQAGYIATPLFDVREHFEAGGTIRTGWQLSCALEGHVKSTELSVERVAERGKETASELYYTIHPIARAGEIVDSEDFTGDRDPELHRLRQVAEASDSRIAEARRKRAVDIEVLLNGGKTEDEVGLQLSEMMDEALEVGDRKQRTIEHLPLASTTAALECYHITRLALAEVFGERP